MSGNFVFAVISGSLGSGFAHGFHAGLLNILSGVNDHLVRSTVFALLPPGDQRLVRQPRRRGPI
jgi:hypothetical protein